MIISRINANELEDFVQRLGKNILDTAFQLLVDTCELGTENESEILDKVAVLDIRDEDLRRALMVNTCTAANEIHV